MAPPEKQRRPGGGGAAKITGNTTTKKDSTAGAPTQVPRARKLALEAGAQASLARALGRSTCAIADGFRAAPAYSQRDPVATCATCGADLAEVLCQLCRLVAEMAEGEAIRPPPRVAIIEPVDDEPLDDLSEDELARLRQSSPSGRRIP